jgi:protein-tyrosine phosphatase
MHESRSEREAPSSGLFRVCFVCTGNVCRSPMAVWVFQRLIDTAGLTRSVEVESGALGAWHVGEEADVRAVRALRARGYDGSHVARQVGAAVFDTSDVVVAFDRSQLHTLRGLAPDVESIDTVVLLRSFDPAFTDRSEDDADLDIVDPYYGQAEGFDRCLDQIERACRGLLTEVREELAAA